MVYGHYIVCGGGQVGNVTERVLVVIPARLQSNRLKDKPLRQVNNTSLIRMVVEQVLSLDLDVRVIVATDSEQVCSHIRGLAPCYLTSSACRNGTERVASVVFDRPEFGDVTTVVNVQGDQLFLPRYAITGPLSLVLTGQAELATPVAALRDYTVCDANRVKVIVAPYTQRCAAFYRLMAADHLQLTAEWPGVVVAEHIGVYAYSRAALYDWVGLPRTKLEAALSLEQVRPLEAGMAMRAVWVERAPVVVDTEEDLKHVKQAFGKKEFRYAG